LLFFARERGVKQAATGQVMQGGVDLSSLAVDASLKLTRNDSLQSDRTSSPTPGKVARDALVGASVVSHKIAGSEFFF
jgi:hypothetical protein